MVEKKIHQQQELIRFEAADGFPITSLLVTKEHKRRKEIFDVPVLLEVHGLLGHFLARGTPRQLPHALLERGFHSLSINTRLAYAGQIIGNGIFDNTIHDIDAAVEFIEMEGFENIYILGYSLGAAMLVNWAANREHSRIKGIILEGGHYSIPDTWKRNFNKWGSSPSYEDVYIKAKEILGDDPFESLNDETFVAYQSRGPTHEPINSELFTYKTWWFMAGPEANNAMAYKHIGKVKVPILMLRGEEDFLVEDWEPGALAKIAIESGNKNVIVKQIAKARHDCLENTEEMLKEITDMMLEFRGQNSGNAIYNSA